MEKIRPLDDFKTQRKITKLTPMVRLQTAPTGPGEKSNYRNDLNFIKFAVQVAPTEKGSGIGVFLLGRFPPPTGELNASVYTVKSLAPKR